MAIDRSEVNRALAKAIAYKQCGKDRDAAEWAAKLVDLLECAEILTDEAKGDARRVPEGTRATVNGMPVIMTANGWRRLSTQA